MTDEWRHSYSAMIAIATQEPYLFQGRLYYRVRGWV
jgi:hypothetical protein